jgi:hypothetical protein
MSKVSKTFLAEHRYLGADLHQERVKRGSGLKQWLDRLINKMQKAEFTRLAAGGAFFMTSENREEFQTRLLPKVDC